MESPRRPDATLQVTVREGLNEPPVLEIGELKHKRTRVLWDPNPQLKNIDMGDAVVYRWKDALGLQWKGGLYRPPDFKAHQRYPLVIQTHGFSEREFRPSGGFTTAMAARELASAGILVLQVGEDTCNYATPEEAACSAGGYEAAVNQLYADGVVDRNLIGIIGFSRSCYSVMHLLTATSVNILAASVTSGVMDDYLEYMYGVGVEHNALIHDIEATIGARPMAAGLQVWLQRSPLFNIQKTTAALLVVGTGEQDLFFMWGPYAALSLLHKPTDIVMQNTDEHVLTNPAVRLASQGGNVDWFRFWLQGYERTEAVVDAGETSQHLREQYARWEKLCDMQVGVDPNRLALCVHSQTH